MLRLFRAALLTSLCCSKRLAYDATVDLVVARHCEDLSWLNKISQQIRPNLKVFIYDKPGKECSPTKASEFPADLHVTVEELRNVARDGHDQMQHIIDHYDGLGTHVAFVQAGFHWVLRSAPPKTLGWSTQQDALNDLLPKLSGSTLFLPITAYSPKGPVLYQDQEDDTDPVVFPGENLFKFGIVWNDMYNQGRELYSMLFGGTPCEAPGQRFTAGMQYIVHRDNIRRRPVKFWKALQAKFVSCDPHMGYAWERLTTAVFNSSAVAMDPSTWRDPKFCGDIDGAFFGTPLDRKKSARYWREEWGCEPLSKRLLDEYAAQF